MKHFSALICLLMAGFYTLSAQESIRITFSEKRISHHPTSRGFQTLHLPVHDSIGFRGTKILPVYPDLSQASDTAFGFIYFNHEVDTLFSKQAFFLVTDYLSDSARFWVDHNLNHDFSDDGPSIGYNMVDSGLVVSLSHPHDPQAGIDYWLTPYRWHNDEKKDPKGYAFMTNMFEDHPNGRGFGKVPFSAHLYDQRRANVAVDTVIGGDSLRIGLHDYDCNGKFNDIGKDKIMAGKYGEEALLDGFFDGAATWEEGALFKPNNQTYEILQIDPYGRWLEMVRSDKPFGSLTHGDTIPNFAFETHGGDSTTLYQLLEGKPYTLIDVWGSWCNPCLQSFPSVKEIEAQYSDQLQVILITSDNRENALKAMEEHSITWPGVWITSEYMETAFNKSFPFYTLIGPDRRVIRFGLWPQKVENWLKE